MSRILAIDYGRKRVGIAVTDPMRIIATPLDTVPTKNIIDFVTRYTTQNSVSMIVVGKPTQMNGTPSQSWPEIELFAKKLKELLPAVEIIFEDERFTSKMASAAIALSDLPRAKRQDKGLVDRTAATIILQSYMLNNL